MAHRMSLFVRKIAPFGRSITKRSAAVLYRNRSVILGLHDDPGARRFLKRRELL